VDDYICAYPHCTTTDLPMYTQFDNCIFCGKVVLTFTATTDILPLNEHYLGIIEAQNEMGSRNGSGIYISKC